LYACAVIHHKGLANQFVSGRRILSFENSIKLLRFGAKSSSGENFLPKLLSSCRSQLRDIKGKHGAPLGETIMENATEGTIKETTYWWPRPGSDKPLEKTTR